MKYQIIFICFLTYSMNLYAGNGLLIPGYGKNASMSGAGVAHPQDALIGSVNSAGSVWVGDRIDFTNDVYYLNGGYEISNNNRNPLDIGTAYETLGVIGDDHPVESVRSKLKFLDLPSLGIVKQLNDKLAIGLAIYGTGLSVRYDRDDTTEIFPNNFFGKTFNGTFFDGTTAVELQVVNSNWHVSYKITDKASIGGGINLAAQSFRAKGLGALRFISQGEIGEWDRDIDLGIGWNLGVQTEVIPNMTFGASYYSKIELQHDKYDGLFAEGDLSLPAQWTVGISINIKPKHTVNIDIQKIYWSKLTTTGNKLTDIFNTGFDITQAIDFTGNFLINPFGSDNNAGFGFSDSTVYKIGYQFELDALPTWTWRFGYSYQSQIIPENGTLFAVLSPGAIQKHYSFGFSTTFWKDYEASFTTIYTGKSEVKGAGLSAGVDVYMEQFSMGFGLAMKF